MKVLNYGSLNVDYVYSVDHIIVGGETQHSSKMEIFSGGKGLNQSIALAKAGVPVYHAGIVGNDGDILLVQRGRGKHKIYPQTACKRRPHHDPGGQERPELHYPLRRYQPDADQGICR